MHNKRIRRWGRPGWGHALVALVLQALWPAANPAQAAENLLPPLRILCAGVADADWPSPAAVPAAAAGQASAASAAPSVAPEAPNAACPAPDVKRGTLSGSGDVIVVVSRDSWDKARAALPQTATLRPRLFINGLAAGLDSALVGTEMSQPNVVRLRFHVARDKTTAALWAAIHRDLGLSEKGPLRASLGWDNTPNTLPAEAPASTEALVRVATPARAQAALGAIVALWALFVVCLLWTDVFRDFPSQSSPGSGVSRATYSLARVQAGAWFFFIVAAGVFIWVVRGELPAMQPSLVALAGLSAATTAASIAVDRQASGRSFKASDNPVIDIVEGWDGRAQLHRIQAVVVNCMLLAMGIEAVAENLAYPVIDATWLALLGVSAVAQTVGKQALESGSKTVAPSKGDTKDDTKADSSTDGLPSAPAPMPTGRNF